MDRRSRALGLATTVALTVAVAAAALGAGDAGASVFLAIAGGVAASFGFALPVATPPNAIEFGTGEITKDQMLRAGVVLDVVMVVV